MKLLYYVEITEEYQNYLKKHSAGHYDGFDQHFLFQLGKTVGETGIAFADLKIYKNIRTQSQDLFLAFEKPEDATAFKLAWNFE